MILIFYKINTPSKWWLCYYFDNDIRYKQFLDKHPSLSDKKNIYTMNIAFYNEKIIKHALKKRCFTMQELEDLNTDIYSHDTSTSIIDKIKNLKLI